MNVIEIAGRLGADPETRFTPSGQKVTTFRVATNSRRKGQDETTWWRITIWGDRFDRMMQYLKKGSAVIVYGTLQKPEIWTNRDGEPQVSLEITAEMIKFSPFGRADASADEQTSSSHGSQDLGMPQSDEGEAVVAPPVANGVAEGSGSADDDDSEIPF